MIRLEYNILGDDFYQNPNLVKFYVMSPNEDYSIGPIRCRDIFQQIINVIKEEVEEIRYSNGLESFYYKNFEVRKFINDVREKKYFYLILVTPGGEVFENIDEDQINKNLSIISDYLGDNLEPVRITNVEYNLKKHDLFENHKGLIFKYPIENIKTLYQPTLYFSSLRNFLTDKIEDYEKRIVDICKRIDNHKKIVEDTSYNNCLDNNFVNFYKEKTEYKNGLGLSLYGFGIRKIIEKANKRIDISRDEILRIHG